MRVPGAADAGVARVGFVEAQPAAASASTARLKPTSLYGRHWACTTRTGVRGLARPYRAAVVRSGEVSPRNFRDSRPRMTFGVTIQDPPQVAIATLPAVGGEAIAVKPLPIPPRMQNVALSGAYMSVPSALPAEAPTSTAVDEELAQLGALEPTSVSAISSTTVCRMACALPVSLDALTILQIAVSTASRRKGRGR